MKKGLIFILGAMVGGAIGWVTGMLSAPRSGQETRTAISEKAIELSNIVGLGVPITPQPLMETAEPGCGEEPLPEADEVDLTAAETRQE